ncbi:hypothetical protein EZJ58_2173 [Sodalis ligni]|uniref:Uncharacterized protein n=1 Tax=Sodalis ligni TaxID=2697027 RepID=A0A4R1NEF7_9GAMM|nr:hypothetical protein EZJ58_2173 [Sodalis ligni]
MSYENNYGNPIVPFPSNIFKFLIKKLDSQGICGLTAPSMLAFRLNFPSSSWD